MAGNKRPWGMGKLICYRLQYTRYHGLLIAAANPPAARMPFALIEGDKAKAVFAILEEKLYTPVGLKSLTADDIHYQAIYEGDGLKRDSAYHEGTVWSWLPGLFVDAIMFESGFLELDKYEAKNKALKVIENFKYHLNQGCIGSVSEIFDGDPPHLPRGSIAQAWGVAEVPRAIKDHELYDSKIKL